MGLGLKQGLVPVHEGHSHGASCLPRQEAHHGVLHSLPLFSEHLDIRDVFLPVLEHGRLEALLVATKPLRKHELGPLFRLSLQPLRLAHQFVHLTGMRVLGVVHEGVKLGFLRFHGLLLLPLPLLRYGELLPIEKGDLYRCLRLADERAQERVVHCLPLPAQRLCRLHIPAPGVKCLLHEALLVATFPLHHGQLDGVVRLGFSPLRLLLLLVEEVLVLLLLVSEQLAELLFLTLHSSVPVKLRSSLRHYILPILPAAVEQAPRLPFKKFSELQLDTLMTLHFCLRLFHIPSPCILGRGEEAFGGAPLPLGNDDFDVLVRALVRVLDCIHLCPHLLLMPLPLLLHLLCISAMHPLILLLLLSHLSLRLRNMQPAQVARVGKALNLALSPLKYHRVDLRSSALQLLCLFRIVAPVPQALPQKTLRIAVCPLVEEEGLLLLHLVLVGHGAIRMGPQFLLEALFMVVQVGCPFVVVAFKLLLVEAPCPGQCGLAAPHVEAAGDKTGPEDKSSFEALQQGLRGLHHLPHCHSPCSGYHVLASSLGPVSRLDGSGHLSELLLELLGLERCGPSALPIPRLLHLPAFQLKVHVRVLGSNPARQRRGVAASREM
mmetsp:Transcript_7606/g.15856  ORF Transcript_7606/g.15856 Transcript_7606/m.15856 type:complete len:606 (+) Transcript_7606:1222-3039(+)